MAELAELRKPPKAAPSTKGGGEPKPARLKMIKPIREGAVGQNQKVVYKLAALREYLSNNTVESSFEAAFNSGMYGFVAMRAPFFAQPERRSDRGRAILIGPAWDRLDPERAGRLRAVLDGKLRAVWLRRPRPRRAAGRVPQHTRLARKSFLPGCKPRKPLSWQRSKAPTSPRRFHSREAANNGFWVTDPRVGRSGQTDRSSMQDLPPKFSSMTKDQPNPSRAPTRHERYFLAHAPVDGRSAVPLRFLWKALS